MTAALVAGLLAGYGIAVPVGAIGAYLVSLTARTSFRIGACAALGVATADGVYALAAVAGGAVLAPLIEPVVLPLRWVSAAVLLALAAHGGVTAVRRYRGRLSAAARAEEAAVGALRAYGGLLALTLLNPMTVIYFAALVLGGQAASGGEAPNGPEQAAFVLAAFAASASWQLLLAGGGALLGRVLTGARGRLVTGLASGALTAVLAVRLL
ncbi:LysE family transporter [Streptomyces sp. 6N223]|uniref:LysE family transporter n=1 Tax=Streptomyces sp. 6N223 TaxID=3457412 RepID=UPI003FCF3C9B